MFTKTSAALHYFASASIQSWTGSPEDTGLSSARGRVSTRDARRRYRGGVAGLTTGHGRGEGLVGGAELGDLVVALGDGGAQRGDLGVGGVGDGDETAHKAGGDGGEAAELRRG